MLVPAALYKEEIHRNFFKYMYEDEMMLYTGYNGMEVPVITDNNDGQYQYAIIDNDNHLIGYLTYRVDLYNSCASCFGLYSFDKNNSIIGIDVYKELRKLINTYKLHRIEWRMIGGNPVERDIMINSVKDIMVKSLFLQM